MTKNEYLSLLTDELNQRNVPDVGDVIDEYEQHFAFKLADGFSEEEIASKLGAPAEVAAQFESGAKKDASRSACGFITRIGLLFAGLFEFMAYLLFYGWILILAAASITSAALGVCLLVDGNVANLIPPMPYASAFIFGVSMLAFAAFLAAGARYFLAYAAQMIRASARWHKNVTSGGKLPPLPWSPQFPAKTRRKLRKVMLWSVTVFGLTFVLGLVVSQMLAGALGFWHAWHWFVS